MKLKKLLAALLTAAQLAVISPAVFADGETDAPLLSYSAEELAKAYGVDDTHADGYNNNIGTALQKHGFSFDLTNIIWSTVVLNDASTAYEPELRFGTRSFSSLKSNVNLMSLNFTKDTINTPAAFNADGYIFESELSIVNRDAGCLDLTLTGKNSEGTAVNLAKIRFVAVDGQSESISGKAFAAKATGVQNGNSVGVKLFSSKAVSNPGELLYVKVAVDFLNGKYSAWVVPRKDSDTDTTTDTYEKIPASDEYLLVENADLLSADAAEFTGISADLTQSRYGNAIKFKNISVTEYTPEVIEATPTPEPVVPDDGINLRVGVVSDLQYGRASQDSSSIYEYAGKKFKNAVNQIIEKAGGLDKLDVLLIPGDITHNSTAAEWQAFVADLEEVVPSGSHTKVLMLRGNHDAKPDLQGNFSTYLAPYDSIYSSANNIVTVNGYTFVLISHDTQRANDKTSTYPYIHSPETVSWFEDAMAEAAAQSEGKPIFVGMHPAAYGTIFGSTPVTGTRGGAEATSDYWGTSELLDTLNKYSNAVTFSGHSHWDMANEMSVYQENFTALNTGAINNMEIPDCYDEAYQPKRFGSNENESTGYYIEVDTDNIMTVHRLDFYRGCEIREPWVINAADSSSWTYTKDRDTTAPYFEESAQITVENITQTAAKVNFTQAKDADSNAVRYQMEFVNNTTGNTDQSYSISSYYWQGADMPETNYWNASGLEAETVYTVKITAYDDFDNASEPLTAEFTTAERPEPKPIIDVAFSGNRAVDSSEYAVTNNVEVETVGEVPLTYNSELKRYEATLARTGSETNSSDSTAFFRTLLPESRRALMKTSSGYTIEAYYKPTAINGSDNVIGAAQTQGFDIETTSDGTLEVYLNNGSGWVYSGSGTSKVYPGSAAKLTAGEYYHVVAAYDGANVKVYLNGELISTHASTGTIIFPPESGNNSDGDENYAMYIGGDYRPTKNSNNEYSVQSYAQNGFTGNIVFTRVYGTALNEGEVSEKYAAIEARKSLTAADDLNDMLTVTIPEMTNTSNKAKMDEYAAEGWALMAKEDVTEAEITAYLSKAEDLPKICYSFTYDENFEKDTSNNIIIKPYGIDYNNTSIIWTPTIEETKNVGMPGVRFTTRGGIGDKQLMKQTFANDTVNKPQTFTGDAFIFETEFIPLHHDDGYLALTLYGSDSDGTEAQIAQLRFNASLAIRTGSASFIDANGNAVGKTISNLMLSASADRGQPASVFYVKAAFDLVNQRYSAWLVTRKQDSSAYAETAASDEYLIVDNAPLNADGITTLTGYSFDITGSSGTNGVWLRSVSVTDAKAAAPVDLTGAITSASVAEGTASATAQLTKAMASPAASAELYIAVYDAAGTLVKAEKASGTVAEGRSTAVFTASTSIEDEQSAKFMLWDSSMKPMCEAK